MLNCKKGDMARQVVSLCGNEGTLHEVVEFVGSVDFAISGVQQNVWKTRRAWPGNRMSQTGVFFSPELDCLIPDAWLRPIRPGDLDEEITTQEPVGEVA